MAATSSMSKMRRARKGPPPGENDCLGAIALSDHVLVPWYLMGAYAYGVLDQELISDGLFDRICRDLDARWDAVEHPHKHLIDRSALKAGTSYYLSTAGDFPGMVRGATERFLA